MIMRPQRRHTAHALIPRRPTSVGRCQPIQHSTRPITPAGPRDRPGIRGS